MKIQTKFVTVFFKLKTWIVITPNMSDFTKNLNLNFSVYDVVEREERYGRSVQKSSKTLGQVAQ